MNNQQLQNLVERITRELLTELKQEPVRKKVLFIFCDCSAHEPFTDQFILLNKAEIDYDLLFLDGETSAWLGLHQIQSTGAKQVIAADEYAKAPIELPKDYAAIVIPEIDLDNVARVCHGLKGSVKAEIIFAALVLNKPVIMGEDVPGIKRADRRTLQTVELPPPYRLRFEKYKEELVELGVHFSKQAFLYKTILELLLAAVETKQPAAVSFLETVVTTEWLASNLGKSKTLILEEGTILTPLAKDWLKEKGIKLIRQRGEGL
jgi:hypothetical protein